jgi:hypothetical protein
VTSELTFDSQHASRGTACPLYTDTPGILDINRSRERQ